MPQIVVLKQKDNAAESENEADIPAERPPLSSTGLGQYTMQCEMKGVGCLKMIHGRGMSGTSTVLSCRRLAG